MNTILSMPKWLIAIPTLVVIFCGGLFFCQYRNPHKTLSEKQTVWLLIGLLIIAAVSIGIFLLTILGWNVGVHFIT
jgi:hypothetical protein